MNVVILGCGRTGATLALELSARGHSITIIEQKPEALRRLGKDYPCRIVIGNGLDEDVITKSGIENADAFFAVTRGDNTNLMAAQIVLRKYGTPKVCVKVADPLRADAYRKMGLFCINASGLMSGMCRDWLLGEPYKTVDEYNTLSAEMEL